MLDSTGVGDRVRCVVTELTRDFKFSAPKTEREDLVAAGLTSMAMVRLMLAIELEFDITIPNCDLVPDNFRSISAMNSLIARLRNDI
jgi:acyl carrier protein